MSDAQQGIVHAVLERAHRTPSRDAVVTDRGRLTFKDLVRRVGGIQRALGPAGRDRPGAEPVVLLPRDACDLAVGMLASMAAGRAFVLLDPRSPSESIRTLAAATGARTAVGRSEDGAFDRVIDPDEVAPVEPTPLAVLSTAPFAHLPTSGTTSDPRVVIRTYADAIGPDAPAMTPQEGDRYFRSFVAVGATLDPFLRALNAGVTLLSVDPRAISGSELATFLREEAATVVTAVPSTLRLLARAALGAAVGGGAGLPDLRLIGGGGDPMAWDDVAVLRALGRSVTVTQSYASTETRIVTRRLVAPDEPLGEGVLSVGSPVPGRQVWIAGDDGHPVGSNEVGRVVVEGSFGAIGPVFEDLPDGRQRFRTQDLGALDTAGELALHGRADGTVKVGAVRIVPASVDIVLRQIPGVREAATVPVELPDGSVRLVAHLEVEAALLGDSARIRAMASERLASNAVPARFVLRATPLPRLASGKVDVCALRAER